MEPEKPTDDELDLMLESSLRVEDPDAERRALAASIRAINHIEPLRCEAQEPARRRGRLRRVVLLLGWIGAVAVVLLAGEIAELLAGASVDPLLASPVLAQAAAWFSVPPVVLAAGLFSLVVVSAVSLRFALADD